MFLVIVVFKLIVNQKTRFGALYDLVTDVFDVTIEIINVDRINRN